MIPYPASLKATGGAHTGVGPVNLLEVLDVNGNLYLWSDRKGNWPSVIFAAQTAVPPSVSLPVDVAPGQYVAFIGPHEAESGIGTDPPLAIASVSFSGQGAISVAKAGLGLCWAELDWHNFHVPTLPAGAVVDAIYVGCLIVATGHWEELNVKLFSATFPDGALLYANSGSEYEYARIDDDGFSLSEVSVAVIDVFGANSASAALGQALFTQVGFTVYYHIVSAGMVGVGDGGDSGALEIGSVPWQPWLLSVPELTFHRSQQTDVGSFVIQNLSGDTLSRDFEKIVRRSALEGAQFVFRSWQADAEAAWIEVHGTLTVEDIGVDTAKLKGKPAVDPSQLDTPLEIYSETCQLQWGGPRCGATGSTECSYNYQTCQQPNRIMGLMNNYEKNFGENPASTALNVINRRRVI